jgi:hypothetical protein
MPGQRRNYFGTWAGKRRLKFWRDVGRVRIPWRSVFVGNVEWSCKVWDCG